MDVDRYNIDGKIRQVMLGARELFPEDLPEESQSWVNRRLQFTHGFGVAISPTTEFTTEGRPEFFLKDIPAGAGQGVPCRRRAGGDAAADILRGRTAPTT